MTPILTPGQHEALIEIAKGYAAHGPKVRRLAILGLVSGVRPFHREHVKATITPAGVEALRHPNVITEPGPRWYGGSLRFGEPTP